MSCLLVTQYKSKRNSQGKSLTKPVTFVLCGSCLITSLVFLLSNDFSGSAVGWHDRGTLHHIAIKMFSGGFVLTTSLWTLVRFHPLGYMHPRPSSTQNDWGPKGNRFGIQERDQRFVTGLWVVQRSNMTSLLFEYWLGYGLLVVLGLFRVYGCALKTRQKRGMRTIMTFANSQKLSHFYTSGSLKQWIRQSNS